ncbi:ABC transporter membrane protein [Candidatus Photodesmus blepharus]|uniref:ABC transporter membrane protein n=1 Tax=Candidatus Photodesmus blepharonis TaxID=1179155 RepID=A0A084CN70_9GAMM|nr:iron ABC transporter permease [Candidatus Photodesmus blepharus]KEY91249.1 ABC transporter membrane protein [Candidatus Photodesmus blepharus]
MTRKEGIFVWKASSAALALLLVSPTLAIFYTAVGDNNDVFLHLLSTVLPTYVFNTLVLVMGVMLVSLILGVPSAWFVAMCKLPSERVLQWALVLPLVMPGYIVAYVFTDWFDFAGPVQVFLRQLTGWEVGEYWFPDIRTLAGATLILALVFYPYVYLLCRAAFMEQDITLLESAKLLRCSPWKIFFRVSLPLIRPAIAVSLSLLAMETIADFGTVSYFSVNTLTTAVYDTWFGYSSLAAASKISAMMLLFVFIALSIERYGRCKRELLQTPFKNCNNFRYELVGWKKWVALAWCWGIVFIAFVFPLLQLCIYSYRYFKDIWIIEFFEYALNSFQISITVAFFSVFIALVVNFCHRVDPSRKSILYMRISSMGYAVPGTILALGVMVPLLFIDYFINNLSEIMEWGKPGLILSGSVFALIFALVVRFSAVAIGSIESSLSKISLSLDMVSQTIGCNLSQMLYRVHFPLIRRGLLVAALLVFIESMKELNAGLLLRPFNFETLATYVFNYASDERLELAALPAVLIVLIGLIPLIIVNSSLRSNQTDEFCVICSEPNV